MTRYDILANGQKAILTDMRPTKELGYVLYGGTAAALQLGHRQSIDFDFFGTEPLDEAILTEALPALRRATTVQREKDTWTVLAQANDGERPVKLSFFGGLTFGRVGVPKPTDGGEVMVASLIDLLAHKLKTLLQRVEAKDYVDIAELLRSGLKIEAGLGAAKALFGQVFPPAEALRAMTYFGGGDLSGVTERDRMMLRKSAAGAGPITDIKLLARDLVGPVENDEPPGDGPTGKAPRTGDAWKDPKGKPTRQDENVGSRRGDNADQGGLAKNVKAQAYPRRPTTKKDDRGR